MKWFQHWTDSHTNKKGRQVLRKQGLEGYAVWWICRELVGKEGKKYRLSASDEWKITLKEVSGMDNGKLDSMLQYHAEINAINRKALELGDLYIPKMGEYSDDYSKRVRRDFVASSLRIDKIRIDKIIQEYTRIKEWSLTDKEVASEIYKRNVRPAKQLAIIAKDYAIEALQWSADRLEKKGLSWTLETIIRWYPEWEKSGKKSEAVKRLEAKVK